MQEHLSEEQIKRYRTGALSVRETVAIDRHLSHCTHCRKQLYKAEEIQAVFRSLQASLQAVYDEAEHLTYEEKKAFVHNESPALEREMVESHVAVCTQCKTALENFQQFAARMDAHPEPALRESLWKRTLTALGLQARQSTQRWAGLAVAAVLMAVVTISVVRIFPSASTPTTEIVEKTERPQLEPNTPTQPTEPPPPEVSPPQPGNLTSPPDVATITLLPGSVRGSTRVKSFAVHEGTNRVRFDVDVSKLSYKSYQATLYNAAGKALSLGRSKPGKGGKAVFTVTPAKQLPGGEYTLMLSGVADDGNLEQAGNCPFRIVKK
jgi:anti-sigma factor RsiW